MSAANQEAKETGAGGGCERTTDRMEACWLAESIVEGEI